MAGILVIVLAAVLLWLLLAPAKSGGVQPEDVDAETLAAAEQEVRDLGASTSPEDADDELPDWGPGVPKPRH